MRKAIFTSTLSIAAILSAAAMGQESTVLKGSQAYGDWEKDAPGVVRQLTPEDLEQPNPQESASNFPGTVPMPEGAMPDVPEGFKAELVASGIENPRAIRFAPNGDLFIASSDPGQVLVLHWEDGAAEPTQTVFASDLMQPYGIAFYPEDNPEWVYVAESDGLRRFAYKAGDTQASAEPETLFKDIPPEHHWTRDIAFVGDTLLYSVGSGSNVGEGTMDELPEGGVEQWAADHLLGVSWGGEERRAAVLAYDVDGTNERYYATGLRNCAGMAVQPVNDTPWCVVNNVDELGDNVPFEFATSVKEGAFYGWPWYYIGNNADPRWTKEPRADLADQVTVPDVLFQAHSAPLNITFYDNDAFGAEYKGDAFVAMHGSWNRGQRTGYKVVRVDFDEAGRPAGTYEDFVTGFVADQDNVWGRPVGVAVSADGDLYMSEDGNGTIWRISKE